MKLIARLSSSNLKIFLVLLLVLVNILLIVSFGSSDMTAWCRYAEATIGRDIFSAHIAGYQLYPLLSTVIFSIVANFWRLVAGPSAECYLGIKISIFVFYILTAVLFFIYSRIVNKRFFSKLDNLLVFLLVFSLIINTQGLAYVDIYTIPSVIASLVFLYKKKYFLAGLLLGITISIKFEPILLVPLYGVTIFNLQKSLIKSIKDSLKFLLGLVPLVAGLWTLLLIYPGGYDMATIQYNVLFKAPYLSGQALNFNWILTYFLHLFQPDNYLPLGPGGLNNWIGGDGIFWPRYIFYLISALIILKYWFFQKKNLSNLLTASIMIFFSHYMINREVHEQHLFYTVILALALYLYKNLKENLYFLILVDIMNMVNLILFYGFTGAAFINRVFLGVDITVIFAFYYLIIYLFVLQHYFRYGKL